MNIAGQAYQDGQEDRKEYGMQRTAEAIEHLAMAKYTPTGLDFQHWQRWQERVAKDLVRHDATS